eukprot:gene13027-biopygen1959
MQRTQSAQRTYSAQCTQRTLSAQNQQITQSTQSMQRTQSAYNAECAEHAECAVHAERVDSGSIGNNDVINCYSHQQNCWESEFTWIANIPNQHLLTALFPASAKRLFERGNPKDFLFQARRSFWDANTAKPGGLRFANRVPGSTIAFIYKRAENMSRGFARSELRRESHLRCIIFGAPPATCAGGAQHHGVTSVRGPQLMPCLLRARPSAPPTVRPGCAI